MSMSRLEAHATSEDELEIIKFMRLNEIFALELTKNGIDAEPLPVGSLRLEREEYYNNDFGSIPFVVTNKGCIKIKGKKIDLIQIIQRN